MYQSLKNIIFLAKKNQSNTSYIFLSILATATRFVKSFIVMRYLNLEELGIITLITAIMGLYGFFQLGLLNGGYRIYCENHKDKTKVNDIVYSYLGFVEIIILIIIIVYFFVGKLNSLEVIFAISGSFMGLIMILNNWIKNILIAERKVLEINKVELGSIIISLGFLVTVPYWGFWGALIVTFSIELTFYIIAIIRNKFLLPHKFNFDFPKYRWILSFGFLPFISGIIVTFYGQIETWSIAGFLSTESLGVFYLARLYAQLFQLVPSAVAKLFTPYIVQSYSNLEFLLIKKKMKLYLLVNALTCVFSVIITYLFLDLVISTFVPIHLVGIKYVWIIVPGLIIYTLLQPYELMLYAAVILKPFFWTSIFSVLIPGLLIVIIGFQNHLSLEIVALSKSVFLTIYALGILFYYNFHKSNIWDYASKTME